MFIIGIVLSLVLLYILKTVLQTSLSCLFSISCINDFRQELCEISPFTRSVNQSNGRQFHSKLTRFNVHDTIETLASEMFRMKNISKLVHQIIAFTYTTIDSMHLTF